MRTAAHSFYFLPQKFCVTQIAFQTETLTGSEQQGQAKVDRVDDPWTPGTKCLGATFAGTEKLYG